MSRPVGWHPDSEGEPVYTYWNGVEWKRRQLAPQQLRDASMRRGTLIGLAGLVPLLVLQYIEPLGAMILAIWLIPLCTVLLVAGVVIWLRSGRYKDF